MLVHWSVTITSSQGSQTWPTKTVSIWDDMCFMARWDQLFEKLQVINNKTAVQRQRQQQQQQFNSSTVQQFNNHSLFLSSSMFPFFPWFCWCNRIQHQTDIGNRTQKNTHVVLALLDVAGCNRRATRKSQWFQSVTSAACSGDTASMRLALTGMPGITGNYHVWICMVRKVKN